MATRIRTIDFLPEIFKTQTNSQFLSATLDQLVQQPNVSKVQGYIGSKFGYGVNANDKYVVEPTKVRKDYQLDPSVVFLKKETSIAQDFITYPGLNDALNLEGAITNKQDRLYKSDFYSWDNFTDLDKLINFNEYYWLPSGPPAVQVSTETVYSTANYVVTKSSNGYRFAVDGVDIGGINPSLTFLRGGTYTFNVDQDSDFWLQGLPGVTGLDPAKPNINTRDVLGVDRNGASTGSVTFTVPYADAQAEWNYPGNNYVDLVTSKTFDEINGQLLSTIGNIDGITSLEGRTLMFLTGNTSDTGFVSLLYDEATYDQDSPPLPNDFGYFEGGYYSQLNSVFYIIEYVGDPSDPIIRLTPFSAIPNEQKITALYGTEYIGLNFAKTVSGIVQQYPYLSSLLDILYYQDGTTGEDVGRIKLIEDNNTNSLNILTEVIGKKNYIAPNGVVFTNGLKVFFTGDIYPASYENVIFYVQGVGTAIQLVSTEQLVTPEKYTGASYTPYDTLSFDIGNFDSTLYLPKTADYITIARNSIDRNAWSRSNRWFHIDVIKATAVYNNNPTIVSTYATQANKAARPIIEFYPNLKLFNSGSAGKPLTDFINFTITDAFTQVAGQEVFYPDNKVYTTYSVTMPSITSASTVTVTIESDQVTGLFEVGQFINDSKNLLPSNAQIASITGSSTLTIIITWDGTVTFTGASDLSFIANDTPNTGYELFDGSTIVFANDTDVNVRTKIYTVHFSTLSDTSDPVITLTEAPEGQVLSDEQTTTQQGYNYIGETFWLDGTTWKQAQLKTNVNQPPLFDIVDNNNISFSDKTVYNSTSFVGTTLFRYGIGSGTQDSILGFPIRYSGVSNLGDISFDVSLNSDTFDYVRANTPITQKVNTGYVLDYSDAQSVVKQLGWQNTVAPSVQYQIFDFDYVGTYATQLFPKPWNVIYSNYPQLTSFVCDIPALTTSQTTWPSIQVYINNVFQTSDKYTVTRGVSTTTIEMDIPNPLIDNSVQILLLSDQASEQGYYQIPINLSNNPFNEDISVVNVGDIRGHYQSIFYNAPDTKGQIFGANNYRDLGNLVPYGNKIIQNSASLVLPSVFLRKQNHNLFNSLLFNSREYVKFKQLLVDTVNKATYSIYQTPASILDDALDIITFSKSESNSFFWSDMVPSKSPFASNTYTFANSLTSSIFPLSKIYDYSYANYNGVLVYLSQTVDNFTTTIQLIRNVDYTISETSPSLTITKDLVAGNVITINQYNQTYGSYVPNTPTKMGLYQSFIPAVVLDDSYLTPTYFILGHDGSYTKLYGEYINGRLVDFRDQALLEFETRIYNNIKVSNSIPVPYTDVIPGFYRNTDYSYEEVLEIYSEGFLNWAGENRVDYKLQYYQPNNQYTWNYNQCSNKIDKTVIMQGYWRGIYRYFYDTDTPDTTPWAMLGYANKPSWWDTRYGPAPFTCDNLVLWEDLAQGVSWNDGNPVVLSAFVRPTLLNEIPVDSAGNLVSPFVSVIGNYNSNSYNRQWRVGDGAPAEASYLKSSTWPFDVVKLLALTKPAEFFNLCVDVDNYRYNTEFDQYLVNDRHHLIINDIEIYGNGIAKNSYINWIVDFEKQFGIDATTNITELLNNLDVRLAYRVAGYTSKDKMKFYVEKASANSNNSSLLIPDESYNVLLYDNQPFDKIVYSSVVVQLVPNGYKVYGNSQSKAYFKTATPLINGNYSNITVINMSVKVAVDYSNQVTYVPYGTLFSDVQSLSQFLTSYGKYLNDQGVRFEVIEEGIPVNWDQMCRQYLYWAQTGWELGATININPVAKVIQIDKESTIVQPLTIQQQNFLLNQDLYPLQPTDLSVVREGTAFTATALNQGDSISYGQFNMSNFEHGIVFDNETVFGDTIYNLTTALKQNRIQVRGAKTAEWNGTVDAQGFILNQNNVQEWDANVKYTKGTIVKYKNKYWVATKINQPKTVFEEQDWVKTEYSEIQTGLLPNPSTNSYEMTLYYDTNQANLEQDADLLGFSLIGYRPRDYLAVADLTDITQVNVYKNLIKGKGTDGTLKAFNGTSLDQGSIDYDLYENWAIKTSEYGGVLNQNYVDFRLNESSLTGNPSIVGLTNGTYTTGVQQEVPLYSLYNYGRYITSPDILATTTDNLMMSKLPNAGYVNFNDIKVHSYNSLGLNTATNGAVATPIQNLYLGNYVWIASHRGTWNAYTPITIDQVTTVTNNHNGFATITFSKVHNLSKYDLIGIINFDNRVNGYYSVASVIDPYSITISLTLDASVSSIQSQGIGFKLVSQRVDQPSDISTLPLLNTEFVKNKAWVDETSNSEWGVYRKSLNYAYGSEISIADSVSYGTAVAYSADLGFLVGDAGDGKVYRYALNALTKKYDLIETLFAQTDTSGTFTIGQDYQIVTLGANTQSEWNTIAGTVGVDYYVGTRFVCANSGITDNTATAGLISPGYGSVITVKGSTIIISDAIANVYVYELAFENYNYVINIKQIITPPSTVSTIWAATVALSGDATWMYISDTDDNTVYVYKYSNVTGQYEYSTNVTENLVADEMYSQSMATDYNGDTLIVGAPDKDYSFTADKSGVAYVYNRTVQNFEAQYTSYPYTPQTFSLAWIPSTTNTTITQTSNATSILTCVSTANLAVNDAIVVTGNVFGGLSLNTVYYITSISGTNITISLTRGGSDLPLNNATGLMSLVSQAELSMDVSINGTIIADSQYFVDGSTINIITSLTAGDIITASGNNFVRSQILNTGTTQRTGVQFGQSVATNAYANELLVGAPFEINSDGQEGAVFRFTNGGKKYGQIIGTFNTVVNSPLTILLNGYAVTIPAGYTQKAADAINQSHITNVQATAVDNKLIISLIDPGLSLVNDKLSLTVLSTTDLTQLGIVEYTATQTILDPHIEGSCQFGTNIAINENNSFIVSAPAGTRYEATTFEFTDDENLDNDTIFDNNHTRWVDECPNAGAVYMFDYLPAFNESLNNIGKFVYAQSVNDVSVDYGSQPMYGYALAFSENKAVIGTPKFTPTNGNVVWYDNSTGIPDWSIYRSPLPAVDVESIQTVQLYSAQTNNTLGWLDYIDPLKGKLLGSVRQNIDVIANRDPAGYNNNGSTAGNLLWGVNQVGKIWLDTSNMRFVDYHQPDVVYNSKYWGTVFPGSDVAVYSWVESNVTPDLYQGPGTPRDTLSYSIEYKVNATGALVAVYYFWVRNSNVIFEKIGKNLPDTVLEQYITNPLSSGISYMAPLKSNVFALYNCGNDINNTDTVMHIGFSTGSGTDVDHSLYSLIRAGYADDFLPGLPNTRSATNYPQSLYERMIDSLSGVNKNGASVPDPFLPKPVQSGIQTRPSQSFFYDRFLALKNYLTYANEVLAQYPIAEFRTATYLSTYGTTDEGNVFDTRMYWSYVNWWATGYNNNTKSIIQVNQYYQLETLINVVPGVIATVLTNGDGKKETYIYTDLGTWERIGLENGTIEFSSTLWDYSAAKLGFGDNFFDTTVYDEFPSLETRYIVRALNEQIYTNELLIHRNKSLILLFEYIQSETIESQNYMPWLNKTSLVDVSHTLRELLPYKVFQSDNQEFLEGYINEAKPYHVVIKEFVFKYTGTDVYEGDITDFDLPASYNSNIEQFITPELVYSNPIGNNQFLPSSTIWTESQYAEWYQHYGLSLTGESAYPICTLTSYIDTGSRNFTVSNAFSLPINGVMLIDDELIGYSSVNRDTGVVSGLSRGYDNTDITQHIPGSIIIMSLPAALLLNGGRGYVEPPKVTAYIDTTIYPAPRRQAIFQANMSLDSVLSITCTDPGDGYAVLPEIIIDSAFTLEFSDTDVSIATSTVTLPDALLVTGDIVRYKVGTNSTTIAGLVNNSWYYVRVVDDTINEIAFYADLPSAQSDHDRVKIYSVGDGTYSLSVGAKASCVTSSLPTRENIIQLRFDRTSYKSRVVDWSPSSFYGSFYTGLYNNSERVSSSALLLDNANPSVDNILASAQGAAFKILDVTDDATISWNTRTRDVLSTSILFTNAIELSVYANETDGYGTTGFYVGMPVKFTGQSYGGISTDTTYYVCTIIDNTSFTISSTKGGSELVLSTSSVIGSPMICHAGNVNDLTVVTINYPGIQQAIATTSSTNLIYVPIVNGVGGTSSFYNQMPVMFTGDVFGGVVQNQQYYITTIVDSEYFTMSPNTNTVTSKVTATTSGTNLITVSGTVGYAINDPVIFTGTTFGGIVAGTTYYVSSIYNNTQFTISEVINGGTKILTTSSGNCVVDNQVDTVTLTTATGSMTCTTGYPISPGQVNGQAFTMYQTSPTYPVTGTEGNYVERLIVSAISDGNYLGISKYDNSLTNIYVNMPVVFGSNFGNLTTGTQYYVADKGTISTTVSITTANNVLVCDSTSGFYQDMLIIFDEVTIGGIIAGQKYYVRGISAGNFNISYNYRITTLGTTTQSEWNIIAGTTGVTYTVGSTFTCANAGVGFGTGTALGQYQFSVSTIPGGAEIDLVADSGVMAATGTSWIKVSTTAGGAVYSLTNDLGVVFMSQTPTSPAAFDVKYILGGYSASITNNGSGYAVGNTFTILGEDIGGTTPANNLTITVKTVSSTGQITGTSCSGVTPGTSNKYYLKVLTADSLAVFYDELMLEPVPASNFNYTADDYAFLPEPFYFDQSIVKYNNKLYECIVSNSDDTFVIGKWKMLTSDSRRLNALDRIVGYYQPTANMPGYDMTQLVKDIVYPNNTYKGNLFSPEDEYVIDTNLKDKVFDSISDTVYDVQGGEFLSGYGPEELVPGVVSDTLSMIVTTRPGTNWLANIYNNVGYNTVSKLIDPTVGQVEFSFYNVVENAIQIDVYSVDMSTANGLGTRLYEGIDYTVTDWINKILVLNTPLTIGIILRIDVWEVGNGDQLVKSNSLAMPLRFSNTLGTSEIYLDCNYSATLSQGSGIFQLGTTNLWSPSVVYHNGTPLKYGVMTSVTATLAGSNYVLCETTNGINVNDTIVFTDSTFGNIVHGVTYYILSIVDSSTFTISTTLGGSEMVQVDASGGMQGITNGYAFAQITDSIKAKIVFSETYNDGAQSIASATDGITNTITVSSTTGFSVDQEVIFTGVTFGNIASGRIYYVDSVISSTEFTIKSELTSGTYSLTTATGTMTVTVDGPDSDYVVFSVFGETYPEQYNYTLPEVQLITSDGTVGPFTLNNYVGGDNTNNAIVEVNGLRVTPSEYTIDDTTNTLTFNSVTTSGDIIAVTSYNSTQRQSFETETFTNQIVADIVSVSNTTPVVVTTGIDHGLTMDIVNVGLFIIGQSYHITDMGTTTQAQWNSIAGTVNVNYAVGRPFTCVYGGAGFGTGSAEHVPQIRIDGTVGSTQLNNNLFYVQVLNNTQVALYVDTALLAPVDGVLVTMYTFVSGWLWSEGIYTLTQPLQQTNTDRLWVTVNGQRINSSGVVVNSDNNLNILSTVLSTDTVVITSMMPTPTPEETIYINQVDKAGTPSVYRANSDSTTWLTQEIQLTDTEIHVHDVSKVVDLSIQSTMVTGTFDVGYLTAGIVGHAKDIADVSVFNNTTGLDVSASDFAVEIVDLSSIIYFTNGVSNGDSITITVSFGNTISINGEKIGFTGVNYTNQTLTGIIRGINGTGAQKLHVRYATVFSYITTNLLPNPYYYLTWNSKNYNAIKGDPLQISTTKAAKFLNDSKL